MPDNPSRREVWEAVVKDEEMRAASLSGRLAAMQARAEKAERERDIARGVAEDRTEAALRAKEQFADALEKVAERVKALEARLAEVGPVVEAAERQETAERVGAYLSDNEADRLEAGMAFDRATHETNNAVRVMRAARSLRGAGDATRPMAADMIDCPRCGRNHAAYIQGCAVEGRSDATGNGWDARGAGEGGGA